MSDEQGFEIFRRQRDRSEGTWLSISARGDLTLSFAAFVALGSPREVELLFDQKDRRIGLRPSSGSGDSYKVGASGKTARRIASRSYAEHYGLPRSVRYEATVEDGLLVVDLNGPSTPVTSPRTGTGRTKETPDA